MFELGIPKAVFTEKRFSDNTPSAVPMRLKAGKTVSHSCVKEVFW